MRKLRMALYYGDQPNTGEYDNGVWSHLLGIPYIANIEQAGDYDVIIRTMWLESNIQGWSHQIRTKFPAVKQIGLSDHPLSTHISRMEAINQVAYLADLQYLDGIMALTEEEREWYQTAVPAVPVVKTGLPFPFDTYNERYGKYKDTERKYIGVGVGAVDNDRNFISSWIAFRRLQLEYPDVIGVFLSIPPTLIPYCTYLADRTKNLYIHERTDMAEFYDILSQCKFVINTADRNSPGRIQAEAAFLGVPVIGSNRLELQRELFPDLAVSPYSAEKIVTLSKLLLEKPELGVALAQDAAQTLTKYNYKASKRRFNKLLKQVLMEE